jgi:hypothetical protein
MDDDSPERHEQPATFRQLVVARARLQTGGAFAANPSVRLNLNFDAERTARTAHSDPLVNKSHEMLNPIQNGLNFQLSGWCFVFHTRFS